MNDSINDLDAVRALLGSSNPVPADQVAGAAIDPAGRAVLDALLAGPRAVPRVNGQGRISRRSLVTASALALATAAASAGLMAAGVVRLPWDQTAPAAGAYAATPPPLHVEPISGTAAQELTAIAARVATMPDDVGTGRYLRTSSQGWNLWTRVGSDAHTVHSVVMPVDTTTWVAKDGSGRSVVRYHQPGLPWATDHAETFGPGQRRSTYPDPLSSDDGTLAAQLGVGHPASDGPAERLVAITDAYGEQALAPAVRAALLRYLAATPTLRLTGTVVDRLGRAGVAVSLDSSYGGLPMRYTLVVDPTDGRVLDSEEMLTTTAGKLDVPVPSVIAYTAYRPTRVTNTIH